jgi:hypothetical protein
LENQRASIVGKAAMTEEKFNSPGNRVLGVIGVALAVAAIVAMAVNEPGRGEAIGIFAVAFVATLSWAFLIRPQIRLTATTVTLRNPLSSVAVPVQLVTAVEVRRYTVIALADSQLTSTAVSRGVLELARQDRAPASGGIPAGDPASLMTARIEARMDESRNAPPVADAEVRRTPAWPEIALLAVSAIGVVFALLL